MINGSNASHGSVPLPSAAEIETLTPMLKQYYELKERSAGAILFFRMGDFYELFGADAEMVAPLLELVLTSRERGDQQRIPFCGVPHHSARNYWLKLLRKGHKVAIADQVEDPAEAKGLVRRDITRILTPGCVDDLEGLERDEPNYVLAIYEDPAGEAAAPGAVAASHRPWAAAVADLSTGELRLGTFAGLGALLPLVEQFRPKEVLARRFFHDELATVLAPYRAERRLLIEALPEAPLRDRDEQKTLLGEVLGKADLASQPSGAVAGGEALVTSLLVHFRSLQAGLQQFLTVRPLNEPNAMTLDETAVRDLELFETVRRRGAEGSLFKELNRTLSPMGARLLRYFLIHPLLDAAQIKGRHAAVRSLVQLGEARLAEVRAHLKGMTDLERLATRIFGGNASPQELAKAGAALGQAQWVLANLTGDKGEKLGSEKADLYKAVATGLKFHRNPLKLIAEALVDAPGALGSGSGVFRAGFDAELDRLSATARDGASQVEAYQERLKGETGIASLKIKDHKSLGLLIEVTKSNLGKVPAHFVRRQTMVNCERYTTVELQELAETLLSASDLAVRRETELYAELLKQLGRFRMDLRSVAYALATFDLLQSFAWKALRQGWCEPKIADDEKVELLGSRHPVVEHYVGRHAFTANDVVMAPKRKHLLITGPNMAGKSTVMRQTAIAAILCQIGSFVPARSARLPVFDRVFTRVGAADDLSRGQSTFMVEMAEAATILRHATPRSLVILDEVGRGTSTQDGLALAAAILKDLATRVRCFTLFATHYHELVPFASQLAGVTPMQTEVQEHGDRVVFTHRLKEGASDSSYGIEVARIAGIPEPVLTGARQFLETHVLGVASVAAAPLEKGAASSKASLTAKAKRAVEGATSGGTAGASGTGPVERLLGLAGTPLGLSERAHAAEVLDRLSKLNTNRMTPLQALNLLAEMQARLTVLPQPSLFPEESC